MKNAFVISGFLLFALCTKGQQNETVKSYINQYKDIAIKEMGRTGVPAAIKLAQGIHESGAGKSNLASRSNNHFGIKCKNTWTGEKVYHDDDEKGECFRKYPSTEESYKDHSDFLANSQRYAFLFDLNPEDYKGWANGLKKAGYATNPKYPAALIKIIEDYNLQEYTLLALNHQEEETQQLEENDIASNKVEIAIYEDMQEGELPKGKVEEVIVEEKITVKPLERNFPEGVFTINDIKVVYAKKGTPYFSIAQQYKVPLKKIFDYNDMKEAEETATDELVFLQAKKKKGNALFHIVAEGETVRDIAQFQAMRLESLLEYNQLKIGEVPAVGERLLLHEKSPVKPKLNSINNYSVVAK